jgi:hypothetical protein
MVDEQHLAILDGKDCHGEVNLLVEVGHVQAR